MVDLSKPLGIHEGLILYGDHESDKIVYYFPDEVGLAPVKNSDGSVSDKYELFFQMFSEGVVTGGASDALEKSAGSILSLGVQCVATPARVEKALAAVKEKASLPEDVVAGMPFWKDGSVNLIVLDADQSKTETMSEDAFVRSVVGANKPSLMSTDLKNVFNVRLNRQGTALVYAALDGDTGSVAGVLYDLKYTCMRPALNMRIWANLGRCYESVKHQLSIKAEFQYYVKFSLGAELSWLTQKMEEDGDLKIEIISQAEDAEIKRMQEEMISEFKESVLKEMFRPYVSPVTATVAGAGLESMVPVVGVAYRFTTEKISHDKILEIDYRERSAIVRTHNPQSHLWVMGRQIGANRSTYIQNIKVNEIWKQQSLTVSLQYDFEDPIADLLKAELIIWRSKDGINHEAKEGQFSIPVSATPILNSTFSALNLSPQKIAWLYDDGETRGYYYQLRFTYNTTKDNINSPDEVLTQPQFTSTDNLIIFPDTYMFYKLITIKPGNISFEELSSVDIFFNLMNEAGETIDVETVTLKEGMEQDRYIIRGKDKTGLFLTHTVEHHYKDERPPIKTLPVYLQDNELIINKPFVRSANSIMPVLAGSTEQIRELLLEIKTVSAGVAEPVIKMLRYAPPDFKTEEIMLPKSSDKDVSTFTLRAITIDGAVVEVDKGNLDSNILLLDLGKLNQRQVTVKWEGDPPSKQDMRSLTLEFRIKNKPDKIVPSVVYSGDDVQQPVNVMFEKYDETEWRIVKKFRNGSRENSEYVLLSGNEIILGKL